MGVQPQVFRLLEMCEANPGILVADLPEDLRGDPLTSAKLHGLVELRHDQVQVPPIPPHRGLRFVNGPDKVFVTALGLRALADERMRRPPAKKPPGRRTWQEVAEQLVRLRSQGEEYTSQRKLAKRLGCSLATINTAIHRTEALQGWDRRQAATPKAQSINAVVTDQTSQSRELDPADEAAIREHLEREDLTPEERAFFNGLSPEDQLEFLDDPDKDRRILGRKP